MKNSLVSQAGLSLVEVLIGTAILAGLGASVFYSTSVRSINASQATGRMRCETTTASAIAYFENQGLISKVVTQVNSDVGVDTGNQFTTNYVDPSTLWANNPPVLDSSTSPPVFQPAMLLGGSIRNLASIYNSSPTFCASGAPYGPLDSYLALANADNPIQMNAKLQIKVFDLTTGVLSCPAAPFYLIPSPFNATANAFSPPAKAAMSPNTSQNSGFLVTIQTTLVENSVTYHCAAQHRFQYQRETVSPPDLSGVRVTLLNQTANTIFTPTKPPPYNQTKDCVAADQETLDVEIGNKFDPMKPGSTYLCQDSSLKKDWQPKVQCKPSSPTSDPGAQPQPGAAPLLPMPALGSGNWQPCNKVTVCGVAPASSVTNFVSTNPSFYFTNHYTNLPSDCEIHVKAIAVDAAGNVSSTASDLAMYTDDASSPPVTDQNLVRPTCGSFCPYAASWPLPAASYPGGGYWQCGGC